MKHELELLVETPKSGAKQRSLLFIHGMWHAAWCWQEHFLPYFAKHGYVSYALSLRGHGASKGRKRLRWASLADYVADVASVVDNMETPPVLIGHSMGGRILQAYLKKRSAPAVILLAPVPVGGLIPATLRVAKRHPLIFLKANLTLSLYPIIGSPERCRELLFSEALDKERLMHYYEQMQDESYRAYLEMLFPHSPSGRLSAPMLVLGAAEDRAIAVKEVQATARAYGAHAEIFPNMAHDMMLEPGWRAVADRILAWLAEQTA
ncbi:MAG: alpha/beta hydrolase [Chloroflexi bacterium]|nr:alpha/beta hydrolase [Chloroflexota bacterium]